MKRWLSGRPRLRGVALALRRRLRAASSAGGHWDARVHAVESGAAAGWLDSELIEREYIRAQISGDRQVDYLRHFLRRHVRDPPVARALSLGCGGGNLERALVDLGATERIDALDLSEESILLARREAEAAGIAGRIDYRVQDIDQLELPAAEYDFVVAKMALHHFQNLEHIYDQIDRALVPGGLLMFNEFVGPSRFQWAPGQLELMNRLFERLPKEIRKRAPYTRIYPRAEEDMIATDPSEAARSAEVMPLLRQRFDVVEHKPYGGSLLHIVLADVMDQIDPSSESHRSLLRSLCEFEKAQIDSGALASDFAYVVARKQAAGA
ncbi:MAG: class I SAM-dependent methyltransferase [bacterium]|nr:class I SAM-dependent methyltransferase [bacterium]